MLGLNTDIGVDLGTATVLIYRRKKGVVLQEPSVVAVNNDLGKVLAVGEEAYNMIGRTPGNIVAIRPMKDGVIADFSVTEIMLKNFIERACKRKMFLKPRIMVCVPAGITSVEQRAVLEAATRAGAKQTFLIEEPRAAALGANLDIFEPSGSMVVDIGGGTTDVAVLSLGDLVTSTSLRIGGDKFDEAIVQYMKNNHNLVIGERTAEDIKKQVGTAYPELKQDTMEVRGRDQVSGLPRNVTISSEEVYQALKEPVSSILECIKQVLEQTPPELSADIMDKGIVITGGGSLLHGLDKLLQDEVDTPVYIPDNPIGSVAEGTGKALEYLDKLESSLISSKSISKKNRH
ncbi:rod shape-determining protein [Natranaerobius thermophilus]|uniref:Cell shape-determining protein MreB n=1 Tax=Natranaerobius thermophilus (strain ATCC BAA-1301 / DSM 18059 / JW/NM-WN-LF) TaxID=457570 RepID=B2A3F3_NATTJ|nr:rod shape-determining protein [Natranaerobius thermophilus]ACB86382.1 rod shape-determining protein MreB [Natranaerobius thermophilus JW/NM-WN-LF]